MATESTHPAFQEGRIMYTHYGQMDTSEDGLCWIKDKNTLKENMDTIRSEYPHHHYGNPKVNSVINMELNK